MMYSCHGLMLARQMCACVAEGARAHGLPHLVIFSLSTILFALPTVYPQFLGEAVGGKPEGSRETPRTLARGGYEGSATTQFRPYTTRSLCSVITAGRWLRSRARSGRREMSRSRVSALSGVARWAAHLLLVGLALPALAVHAGTRMPPVSDGSLRLRGGAQELKIEHRAFVVSNWRVMRISGEYLASYAHTLRATGELRAYLASNWRVMRVTTQALARCARH